MDANVKRACEGRERTGLKWRFVDRRASVIFLRNNLRETKCIKKKKEKELGFRSLRLTHVSLLQHA